MKDAIQRRDEAICLALEYGMRDGSHHKMWVIDQMLRILAGDEYETLIHNHTNGLYNWDEGIAP